MKFMKDTKDGIRRANYDILKAFPPISEFPVYEAKDSEIAVLIRLFLPTKGTQWSNWFYIALWSMRSHILNSDMRDYKVKFFFHTQASLFDITSDIFEKASVPRDAILVYPDNLIASNKRTHTLYYAASPFLDERLDNFEYVIVLDADQFSIRSKSSAPLPLISISIEQLPTNEISLTRGWICSRHQTDDYMYWYRYSELGKRGWMEKVAAYCGTTPQAIEDIMHPANPQEVLHPGHCGSYIKIPMRLLRDNPDFRKYMRSASAELGHEEMALGMYYIKHFVDTGEKLPLQTSSFHSAATTNSEANVVWDAELARAAYYNDRPCLLHLCHYDNIVDYAAEFATLIGASDSERDQFVNTIIRDVTPLLKQKK